MSKLDALDCRPVQEELLDSVTDDDSSDEDGAHEHICIVHSGCKWQRSKLTGACDTEDWDGFGGGGFGGFGGQLVQLPDGRVIPRALLMQVLRAQHEQESAEEDEEDGEQGGQGCRNQ